MKITQLTKGTGVMNYLMYEKCDIIVPGLMEHIGYIHSLVQEHLRLHSH